MLARFVESFYRTKLDSGAVKSLEYAMIVMMVALAAAGAVSTPKAHAVQATAQTASTVQVASTN